MTEEPKKEEVVEISTEVKVEPKIDPKDVPIIPSAMLGENMVAMLVCIRAPSLSEGKFTMCELELHTKSGGRGRIYLPYLSELGNLGSTWEVDLMLRSAEQKTYLKNRADTLDLVREDDGSSIIGVV